MFLVRLLDSQVDLNDHIVNQKRLESDTLKGICKAEGQTIQRLEEDIEEDE